MHDPSQFNTDRTYPGRWTITFQQTARLGFQFFKGLAAIGGLKGAALKQP